MNTDTLFLAYFLNFFFMLIFCFFSITSLRTELYTQRAILESISSQLGARTNDGRSLLDDCQRILKDQAPVVQTLDSAIHRINHYPADKYQRNQLRYPVDRFLSCGQRHATFEQPQPVSFPKIICRSLILYKGYRIYQKERRIFPATIRSLGPGSAVEEKDKKQAETVKKKYIGKRGKLNRGLGRRKGPRLLPSSLRSPIFFSSFFPNAEPPGQTIRRMRIFNFNLVNPKIIIRLILLDGC